METEDLEEEKNNQQGKTKSYSIVLPELISKIFISTALFTVDFSQLHYNVIQRALQRNLACM